jgi:hypothetical protein
MDLSNTAFRKERCNIQKRIICVRVQQYVFPDECLLCGSHEEMVATTVEFKAVLLLGVVGGGETTTLQIPLCEKCSRRYLNAQQRTKWISPLNFLASRIASGTAASAFLEKSVVNRIFLKSLMSMPSKGPKSYLSSGLISFHVASGLYSS